MLGSGKSSSKSSYTWGLFYIPRITPEGGLFADDHQGSRYIFTEVLRSLGNYVDRKFGANILRHSDTAVNEYVRNYGMVLLMLDHERRKLCFSASYRPKLPQPFIDRVRETLRIMPDDTLLWADDVFKEPQEAPAREVLYGERLAKPPRQSARRHPEALSASELDYLTGKNPPTT